MSDSNHTVKAAPDLASILQSLAALSKQQQNQVELPPQQAPIPILEHNQVVKQPNTQSFPSQYPSQYQQQFLPRYPPQYPPQQQYSYPAPQQQYGFGHAAQSGYDQNPGPRQNSQGQYRDGNGALRGSGNVERKVVDPATIVEWSAGLRCVMRTVAKHDQMIHEVRGMIKTQRDHEKQWWDSREALIEKQKARIEGREKLASVLRSIGSTNPDASTDETKIATEEAEELRIFDTKVYRAQLQMVKEMSTKLKGMGVPFFGTRSELVRIKDKDKKGDVSEFSLDGVVETKGKIDEEDLIALQRKMLGILEDLCEG